MEKLSINLRLFSFRVNLYLLLTFLFFFLVNSEMIYAQCEPCLDDDGDGIANEIDPDCTGQEIFVPTGDAIQDANDGNCYQITAATNGQQGAVWSADPIDISSSFNFSFDAFLGNSDSGADGIAFVFQCQGPSVFGGPGGGLGYAGLTPSIAIEFDTYPNGATGADPASGADHVVITAGGSTTNIISDSGVATVVPNIEDGAFHPVIIDWNATTNVLTVSLDGTIVSTHTGDIAALLGCPNDEVWFGFTGSTGGLNNLQQICIDELSGASSADPPICISQDITIQLDATGMASITDADIDNGSYDDCTAVTLMLDNYDFDCTNIGNNTVTLTVTDLDGNATTCTAIVTVEDPEPPVAVCQDVTIDLDANGEATIVPYTTTTVLFQDDFTSYTPAPNTTLPIGGVWNVTNGAVDVTGNAIDLDGTFSNGTIETINTFTLTAGNTYILVFTHQNNNFNGTNLDNGVNVTVGSFTQYFASPNDPNDDRNITFKQTMVFTPTTTEMVTIEFEETGTPSSGGTVMMLVQIRLRSPLQIIQETPVLVRLQLL